MNLYSWLIDRKIDGINVNCDISIEEYEPLISKIIENNELQRKKVKNNKTAYSLLKKDLLDGCIMPPIILAVTDKFNLRIKEDLKEIIAKNDIEELDIEKLNQFISEAIQNKEILILDGLQRTFTIDSTLKELKKSDNHKDKDKLEEFYKTKIRTEIYLGLDKMGILYRMFTLNTGQTPMTFRHQLEMLYSDFIDSDELEKEYNIKVLRENDDKKALGLGSYKYQDIIDMFYAFNIGSAQLFEADTLISKLKEMDFLKNYDKDSEDMKELLLLYNNFVARLDRLIPSWKYTLDVQRPFGKSISGIFEKSQAMSGFGAACSNVLSKDIHDSLKDINKYLEGLDLDPNSLETSMDLLVNVLDDVGAFSKKIGNSQRQFFEGLFYYLLNPENNVENQIEVWPSEAYVVFSTKYGL